MTQASDCFPTADAELDAILRQPPNYPWDLDILLGLWRARRESRNQCSWTAEVYRRIGHRLARLGDHLLAYDVAEAGLECWPGDVRLRQLKGLALARSGDIERADRILSQLHREGHKDEETLGLLARVSKDRGIMAVDAAERRYHLARALELYDEAHHRHDGYWTGINGAATATLLGQSARAKELAGRVRDLCLHELGLQGASDLEEARRAVDTLQGAGHDPYWPLATLGEAALILEKWKGASDLYGLAAAVGRGRFGDLNATRRQARLLAEHLGVNWEHVDRCFRIPQVVVFIGHMIDLPGRPTPRFPGRLELPVRNAIRERLRKLDTCVGFASAACGSDILFLESVLEKGADGEVHVVLPYHRDQFRKDSVDLDPEDEWAARFDRLLGRAQVINEVSAHRLEGGVSYDYSNQVLNGLAMLHAGRLETNLVRLAVWDGQPGDGPGGTASAVARWRASGHDVEVLDLAQLLAGGKAEWKVLPGAAQIVSPPERTGPIPEFGTEILAILFGDVVGFSKLTEDQIPLFVTHFLGTVAEMLAGHRTVKKNTWGDGLYLVFESVRELGCFALDLRDRVASIQWEEVGLPRTLGLRIALHAGPVYHCVDPVTGLPNCLGTHVSHAARIEPITPPNQVYASQAFAALAESDGVQEFACQYVGKTPLAKDYGTYPTYHVHRRPH
jgi:class 3 adenylate cyclase